eukprot:scaffold284054_cov36-Tisochrysis_lutea.AAC.3
MRSLCCARTLSLPSRRRDWRAVCSGSCVSSVSPHAKPGVLAASQDGILSPMKASHIAHVTTTRAAS